MFSYSAPETFLFVGAVFGLVTLSLAYVTLIFVFVITYFHLALYVTLPLMIYLLFAHYVTFLHDSDLQFFLELLIPYIILSSSFFNLLLTIGTSRGFHTFLAHFLSLSDFLSSSQLCHITI